MDRQGGREKVRKMMGEDERWCSLLITQMRMIFCICVQCWTENLKGAVHTWEDLQWDMNPPAHWKKLLFFFKINPNILVLCLNCRIWAKYYQKDKDKWRWEQVQSAVLLHQKMCWPLHSQQVPGWKGCCGSRNSDIWKHVMRNNWFIGSYYCVWHVSLTHKETTAPLWRQRKGAPKWVQRRLHWHQRRHNFVYVLQNVPPGAHKTFKNHNKKMSKIPKIYNTWCHLFFLCFFVCFFEEFHYSLFRTWYFRASLHLFTCLLHSNTLQIFRSDKKREPLLSVLGVRHLDGQQIKTLKRISGNKAVASKDVPGLNFSAVFPWRVTRTWIWNI